MSLNTPGPTPCRDCGADILYARTMRGRAIPIDLEPRPDGNLAVYRDHLGILRARVATAEWPLQAFERPGMPHFATCAPLRAAAAVVNPDGTVSLAAVRRRHRNAARKLRRS